MAMLVAAVPARADDPAAPPPTDPAVVATTTDTAPVPPPPEVTPPATTDVTPPPTVVPVPVPPAPTVAPTTTTTAPTTTTTPAPVPTVTTEMPAAAAAAPRQPVVVACQAEGQDRRQRPLRRANEAQAARAQEEVVSHADAVHAAGDRHLLAAARLVPDPAVPAADLPGRRRPVRDPLAGARRDQRDRVRLRPQPQRLERRRAGLDAVHALHVEAVRRRRQRRRQARPVQPGRRDLRGRAVPEGRRRRHLHPPVDLRLQPRRLVRELGAPSRAADLGAARRFGQRADRPDPGPPAGAGPLQGPAARRRRSA